jgi:DNA repair exonuclease SbcCD ATPase subunit
MNIQDNAQKSSDYYKELKTVRKEIEKIYKQLSKDETLSDMIGVIQNDIGKNINFIFTPTNVTFIFITFPIYF